MFMAVDKKTAFSGGFFWLSYYRFIVFWQVS